MGQPVAFFEVISSEPDRARKFYGERPMDLPDGSGRIAIFADPDGNPVGLWA